MRQEWCIGLRLPVQLRSNNHQGQTSDYYERNIQKTVEIVNSFSISAVTSVKSIVIM